MLITTTLGEMDEVLLEKREGIVDDSNEHTTWVEYRLPGQEEIIHRSVHVHLKQSAMSESAVGEFR